MMSRISLSGLSSFWTTLACTSALAVGLGACSPTQPASDPPPAEAPTAVPTPAEGSAAPAAPVDAPAAPPTDGAPTPAPRADGQPATCDFVPTEVPVGGVTCPEGCVMVKGAPLNAEQQCAMTGFQYEVALACLRLPMDVVPEGACYMNNDGHAVMSALTYPAISERGWLLCPDDFPLRAVPPCAAPGNPTEGAPADQAPAAPTNP